MVSQVMALVQAGEELLRNRGVETSRLDAELLLAHLLGCERLGLVTFSSTPTEPVEQEYQSMIERRAGGEPLAYITGIQAFWDHDFVVNEHTLIPRQDTETLVEVALASRGEGPAKVLDLGTGTGCILLSLLAERTNWQGVGLDVSSLALEVARENARRLGLTDRISLVESDWFSALNGQNQRFSLIVSNPPYVASADMEALMREVKDFEPALALDGGRDGLDPYRLLAEEAPVFLEKGGLLAVEVGVFQSNDVFDIFEAAGLVEVTVYKDLPGQERVISGRKR